MMMKKKYMATRIHRGMKTLRIFFADDHTEAMKKARSTFGNLINVSVKCVD